MAVAPPLATCSSSTDTATLTTSSTASVPSGSLVFAGAMNAESGVTATPETVAGAPATIRARSQRQHGNHRQRRRPQCRGERRLRPSRGPPRSIRAGCVAAFAAAGATPTTLPATTLPAPTTTRARRRPSAARIQRLRAPRPPRHRPLRRPRPARSAAPGPTVTPVPAPTPIGGPASPLGSWTSAIGSHPPGRNWGTATMVMQPALDTYRSPYFDTDANHDGVLQPPPSRGRPRSGAPAHPK